MTEAELQRQCVAWFRATFPGAIIAYINNNASNPGAGYRNKLLGTLRGMPDLIIYQRSGGFSGFAIEMKAPGRRPSGEQTKIHDALTGQGFIVAVISSFATFQNLVTAYMAGGENN